MRSSLHARLKRRPAHREGGYILITLMLMVALLAIGMMVATSKAAFQARRDREEELVHRGVQYARAVRLFFKKTGRYPTRVEELENTNNLRFLRKRYKDPITGEDFKILRMGDVKLTFGQGIAGAMTPQAIAAAQNGQGPGMGNAISRGLGAMAGQQAGMATQTTVTATASDSSDDSSGKKSDSDSSDSKDDKKDKQGGSGLTFGGGPIVGVASTSKKESIREFNKKKQYDQWQFIYDPSSDRGGLLNTPAQPPLQGTGMTGQQTGVSPGTNPGANPQMPNPQSPNTAPQAPNENQPQN